MLLDQTVDFVSMSAPNDAIGAGKVDTVAGVAVRERISEGLITTDHKVIYRVEDGIPVMLPEPRRRWRKPTHDTDTRFALSSTPARPVLGSAAYRNVSGVWR